MVQEVLPRRQESWRWGGYWPAIGSWQWLTENWSIGQLVIDWLLNQSAMIEADPLTATWKVAKELNVDHSVVWSKLERRKKSINGCLMSWLQIKKSVVLKHHLLLFYAMTNHFSTGLWLATESGLYMTNGSVAGPRRCSKALPKAKLTRKKWLWPLFGDLLLVWCTTAFWIPVKHEHLRSMLSKSVRFTENCNAGSWHWSTGWAQFFSKTTPDRT